MAELKTRIVLRNGTHEQWEAVKSTQVLMKGEVGIEFDGTKARVKIGDGSKTWANLPYFGEEAAKVYQVEVDKGADHQAAIATAVGTAEKRAGDIAIVKELIAEGKTSRQYTSYVYDGQDFVAMDGNYSADNVIMSEDITLAGDYTQVGNLTKTQTGTATFATKGKSVAAAFTEIFSKRLQPATPTLPTASFKNYTGDVNNKTVEPGYHASGTVNYELQLATTGSYTYGPSPTGVQASNVWSLEYNNGTESGTKDTKSGSFSYDFVVGTANKQVKVTASSVGYTDGLVAKDNLGSDSNPVKKIVAGTASAGTKTTTFTSSRKSFWAVDNNLNTVLHPGSTVVAEKRADNWLVRNLASNEFGTKTSYSLSIPSGNKRVIIAVPGSKTMKSCIDVDGMGLDIKDKFTTYSNNITVGGCDSSENALGEYTTTYTVFIFENAAGMAKSTFNITLQ